MLITFYNVLYNIDKKVKGYFLSIYKERSKVWSVPNILRVIRGITVVKNRKVL